VEENTVDQKILEKLQKLLALSASDNENEAKLAMGKAEALMREHNLSVADVALNGSGAHVKSEEVLGTTKGIQKWEESLGTIIAWTFNGRAIRSGGRNGDWWKYTFIAGRTDLEIIVDLFERLRETIKRMSKQYVAREYFSGFRVSRDMFHKSYRLGVVGTIIVRLKQLKQNTTPDGNQKNAHGLTGTDLMVVKDKAVDQRVGQMFPNLKKGQSRRSTIVSSAYRQGQDDGQAISLHRSLPGEEGPRKIGR
jgi:Protein of unknown function (DUF2786)